MKNSVACRTVKWTVAAMPVGVRQTPSSSRTSSFASTSSELGPTSAAHRPGPASQPETPRPSSVLTQAYDRLPVYNIGVGERNGHPDLDFFFARHSSS